MTRLVLALLEVAPDEETAQLLCQRAIETGIETETIKTAWLRGKEFRQRAREERRRLVTEPREVRPEDFRRAADVLREGGLARETYRDHKTGGHCIIGALMAAKGVHWWREVEPHVDFLGEMLGSAGSGTRAFGEVAIFNDDVAESVEEPIRLLEQAAEKLEADLS